MQTFVQRGSAGRAGSPQGGRPSVNPNRQAIAANARVPMTKHGGARSTTGPPALPVRGESAAQQQPVSRGPSGEGLKRNVYDTDAESIDTTVNRNR